MTGYTPSTRGRTSWLHRVQCGQGAAQKSSVFGLPPRVDDDGLAFTDDLVVPPPHLRFDGLTHRRHVLEVIVVLLGLVRPCLTQHADGCRRGVEDVHAEALRYPPGTCSVRI